MLKLVTGLLLRRCAVYICSIYALLALAKLSTDHAVLHPLIVSATFRCTTCSLPMENKHPQWVVPVTFFGAKHLEVLMQMTLHQVVSKPLRWDF